MDLVMEQENYEATGQASIPDAQEMLARLRAVDVQQFDLQAVSDQLKGRHIWVSILTIPVSTILLVLITLIGTFAFDQPIFSFILAAGLLYWIAKMFDGHERSYKVNARNEVMQRIAETEGDFGLIPHFKHFLPQKYRHLWQSLRKGNYIYIEQYVQAILLLQNKLDDGQFTHIWYLTHPEITPEDYHSEYAYD